MPPEPRGGRRGLGAAGTMRGETVTSAAVGAPRSSRGGSRGCLRCNVGGEAPRARRLKKTHGTNALGPMEAAPRLDRSLGLGPPQRIACREVRRIDPVMLAGIERSGCSSRLVEY